MGEDINTVSPTLGFIIKTIDYEGYFNFIGFTSTHLHPFYSIFNSSSSTLRPKSSYSLPLTSSRYKLNIWDVGGQKTLRSYWRNYFEKTDALIWVVDATDRLRIEDCREELHGLLQEERLSGATLLVFANKTDVNGCMDEREIQQVSREF